ncbi:uncharacterized protein EKO05_0004804 [Ascochyta rabiei]|uniref:uncharacterized protein n=1 Tax=Didymella rabiei TaxID=5454 RepID=UPI0021FEC3AB|nr:uncharacterized protein EKO05_0004804 [Ascochyta rabiei]UPX14316.1 hypothetical protein EKO05_0004804 [Ascochyta rabiei]
MDKHGQTWTNIDKSTNIDKLRHHWTVHPPSLMQRVAYILLLACLVCMVTWFSLHRRASQRHAATEKSQSGPDECPFTIRQLNQTTYLVRERDRFGEYPHIYVKKHTETLPDGQRASVLIVNDTGCGTSTRNHTTTTSQDWNIRTFIDHHLNPNRDDILYLVILSHCHYDHILGLEPLLHSPQRRNIAILSSSHDPAFLHPRSNLEQHSLCASMNLRCPVYRTSLWAAHDQHLTIPHPHLPTPLHLPLTTLHIPGHTPDSLAWYDAAERALYVGDALYERQSPESRAAPWGGEAPAPILFPGEGDLVAWWRSVHLLLGFVERRNAETACRCVTLSAGHVTVGVDAVACLLAVRRFMARVLRGEVEVREQPEKRGERFGYWVEEGGRFSLGAPLRVVGEGRVGIPEDEWREGGMVG